MNIKEKRAFKERLYEVFAGVAKAFAQPHRIELVDLLSQAERSVEELASETGLSVANVSQHLQVLREARMVEVRREGTRRFYRVADESGLAVWRAIRAFGESQFAEVERVIKAFLGDREVLEAITAEKLIKRIEAGEVVILDVRPRKEYDAGHIRGAISMPLDELKARLKELPRKKEIVAYCRGPYCVFSYEAVNELKARGFKARRLEIGLPDWRALRLPVAVTPQMA